jgi:UDPglucose 6-dehydrogenase
VVQKLFGTVTGKRIAILGFAFKADTNDTREAPAIRICQDLLEEGAELAIYDPKVSKSQVAADLGFPSDVGAWESVGDPVDALVGADAVLILTEWSSFADLDWMQIAALMRHPAWVFDARNCINQSEARGAGLSVWCVGKGE